MFSASNVQVSNLDPVVLGQVIGRRHMQVRMYQLTLAATLLCATAQIARGEYHPALGRFMQRDPHATGMAITAAQAINGSPIALTLWTPDQEFNYRDGLSAYDYVRANPVSHRDPTGLYDDFWADYDEAMVLYEADREFYLSQLAGAVEQISSGIWLAQAYAQAAFLSDEVVWEENENAIFSLATGGLFARACFAAGTSVVMADGALKPIESIQAGDAVLCDLDPTEGVLIAARPVLRCYQHFAERTVLVTLGSERGPVSLQATPEHPVYRACAGGYVPIGSLKIGDAIESVAGYLLPIHGVASNAGRTAVFNLEVAEGHNYFVTSTTAAAAIQVHNGCAPLNQQKVVSTSQTIAKGSRIRQVNRLVEQYGGSKRNWSKRKGWDDDGTEWHWYENLHDSIGRKEWKIKRVVEQ